MRIVIKGHIYGQDALTAAALNREVRRSLRWRFWRRWFR